MLITKLNRRFNIYLKYTIIYSTMYVYMYIQLKFLRLKDLTVNEIQTLKYFIAKFVVFLGLLFTFL